MPRPSSPPAVALRLRQDHWPPWGRPEAWREAQTSLDYLLERRAGDLNSCRRLARRLEGLYSDLQRRLEALGSLTCRHCAAPCCRRAFVWFDFADLLFLHLRRHPLPLHQPRRPASGPCAFLAEGGCRLPRMSRPWVCTWYLCPDQMRCLRAGAGPGDHRLLILREAAAVCRGRLEDAFVAVGAGKREGG